MLCALLAFCAWFGGGSLLAQQVSTAAISKRHPDGDSEPAMIRDEASAPACWLDEEPADGRVRPDEF